jgi:predicted phage-related endonuclease
MTPAQLELRRSLLTATDAPAICGVSRFRTVHDVYADKKGIGRPFTGNARTRAGTLLEPVILEMGRVEHGLPLIANADTIVDPVLTWLGATPDAFEVVGDCREGVGECKAVGYEMAEDWSEDSPPDYVLCQVTIQMHVARVSRCRVLGLFGTELRLYTVERDEDLETAILERMDEFRRLHIETNTPPTPDGSEAAARLLSGLFPRSRGRYVDATPALDTLAHQIIELRAQEADIEKRRKVLEQEVQGVLGEAEGVEGQGWRCTWKTVEASEVKAYTRAAYRRFEVKERKAKGRAA